MSIEAIIEDNTAMNDYVNFLDEIESGKSIEEILKEAGVSETDIE